MKAFFGWLDQRTGYRKIAREACSRMSPAARAGVTFGAAPLTFALGVQFITGIFLWMA